MFYQRNDFQFRPLLLQVILFEIDCAIFYTNFHELFCQFISLTNLVNSGKFMDNCWISCQVMSDMKKVYDDLIIINLYRLMVFLSARRLATPLALDIRNKKFSVISLESMIVCKFLAVSSNFRKTFPLFHTELQCVS